MPLKYLLNFVEGILGVSMLWKKYLRLYSSDQTSVILVNCEANWNILITDVFWMLDVSRTASYEITLVRLSFRLSLSFLKIESLDH